MNAFDVLDGLLILEQSGKGIREFFEANDVKRVIVYGLGRIGVRSVDAIRKANIDIIYCVDKDADYMESEELRIITPEAFFAIKDDFDLIVVTPCEQYYDIKEELEKKITYNIISMAEIVEYCLDGEESLGSDIKRQAKPIENKKMNIDIPDRSRKILIFGGGSGIGKAIAKCMIEDGSSVVIAGRSTEKLEHTKGEIDSDRLFTLKADITDINIQVEFLEKAANLMNGLDSFVNAAAISLESRGRGYEPWDITEEEWDEMCETDLKAAFFLIRNEVNYFLNNHIYGNVLNISSNAAYMDIKGAYGASKLAISKWTRAFGKKYGHDGIVINCIAPGATFTPMISAYAKYENQPYVRHAIERLIKADEIAKLARFCLGDEGVILCGTTIVADGGDSEAY